MIGLQISLLVNIDLFLLLLLYFSGYYIPLQIGQLALLVYFFVNRVISLSFLWLFKFLVKFSLVFDVQSDPVLACSLTAERGHTFEALYVNVIWENYNIGLDKKIKVWPQLSQTIRLPAAGRIVGVKIFLAMCESHVAPWQRFPFHRNAAARRCATQSGRWAKAWGPKPPAAFPPNTISPECQSKAPCSQFKCQPLWFSGTRLTCQSSLLAKLNWGGRYSGKLPIMETAVISPPFSAKTYFLLIMHRS